MLNKTKANEGVYIGRDSDGNRIYLTQHQPLSKIVAGKTRKGLSWKGRPENLINNIENVEKT